MKLLFVLSFLSFNVFSQSNGKIDFVNKTLDSLNNINQFNGIIAIIDSSDNIDFYSRGYSDFKSKNKISINDKMNVMSLAKAIYSNYYLDTFVKNPLILSKKVKDFLPDFPDSILKVIDLINHKTKIDDPLRFYSKGEFLGKEKIDNEELESSSFYYSEIKKNCFSKEFKNTNSQYNYCNANYFLLAKIMEVLYNKNFDKIAFEMTNFYQFKDHLINKNLLLDSHGIIHPAVKDKNVIYTKKDKESLISLLSQTIGLNDLYLSINDIKNFHKYLRTLSIEKQNIIFNNCFTEGADSDLSMCFGMRVVKIDKYNTKLLFLPGSVLGAESLLIFDMNSRKTLFAFNTNENHLNFKGISKDLLTKILKNYYVVN